MKALSVLLLIGVSSLLGCGGGGGGGSVQAAGPTTVVTDVTIGFVSASSTDGVQVAVCPANATAISAGCHCEIPTAGPIFGLELTGNGAICGCYPGTGGAFSPVSVTATCSSLVFGTVISGLSGVEVQASHTPQADAKRLEEWAAQRQQKEAQFRNMRGL